MLGSEITDGSVINSTTSVDASEALTSLMPLKASKSADVVDTVYKTLKIPAAAPAGAVDIEQVKQMIAGLPTDRKARLLKYLTKQPAAPAQTAAA